MILILIIIIIFIIMAITIILIVVVVEEDAVLNQEICNIYSRGVQTRARGPTAARRLILNGPAAALWKHQSHSLLSETRWLCNFSADLEVA